VLSTKSGHADLNAGLAQGSGLHGDGSLPS
jgi:hypothetical protein